MNQISIIATNKYSDHCYRITGKAPSNYTNFPKPKDFWTIQNPPAFVINYYKSFESQGLKCQLRDYFGKSYLLSPSASKIISTNTKCFGATGVLSFIKDGTRYFIMMVDNKKYLQNPQGGREQGETALTNVKREINEELSVVVTDDQCTLAGDWKFSSFNKLIGNTRFDVSNNFFYVDVELSQVQHLITKELLVDQPNVFPTTEYDFTLDETKYVIIVSEQVVIGHGHKLIIQDGDSTVSYDWNGHHREIMLRRLGKTRYTIRYLESFNVY